jgi:CheY-like chemotaxis protein
MAGILVIESDRRRQILFTALLRQHAQVEITIVESVQAAIASFETSQPDLIVTPTLLSCEDSDRLCSHVKRYADPHVQMLSLPALDLLGEPPAEDYEVSGFFRRRRPAGPRLQYDPALVGGQIIENLERAQQMRDEWPADRERHLVLAASEDDVRQLAAAASVAPLKERRRDQRMLQQFPALWTVQLPGGGTAEVLNISRGGILLESHSLVSPGVTLQLHVNVAGENRLVPAVFLRSEVARIAQVDVRYRSAARFDHPFEIPGLCMEWSPRETVVDDNTEPIAV